MNRLKLVAYCLITYLALFFATPGYVYELFLPEYIVKNNQSEFDLLAECLLCDYDLYSASVLEYSIMDEYSQVPVIFCYTDGYEHDINNDTFLTDTAKRVDIAYTLDGKKPDNYIAYGKDYLAITNTVNKKRLIYSRNGNKPPVFKYETRNWIIKITDHWYCTGESSLSFIEKMMSLPFWMIVSRESIVKHRIIIRYAIIVVLGILVGLYNKGDHIPKFKIK